MSKAKQKTLITHFISYREDEDDMPTEIGRGIGASFEDGSSSLGGVGRIGGGSPGMNESFQPTELAGRTFLEKMDETQIDIPETGLLGLFWVVEGERRGRIYKLHDGDLIGRRDGALILDDPKVSTPHCRLRIEKDAYIIWDCGSKNSTFVNNKQIRCATVLEENDRIRIGDTTFTYKVIK